MGISEIINKAKELPSNVGLIIIIILATPIWLPISIWKIGLVFADNIIKKYINA